MCHALLVKVHRGNRMPSTLIVVMAGGMVQDVTMLKTEAEKQQVYLDRVLERKRQLLDVELPQLCKSLASMQCLDAIKVTVCKQPRRAVQPSDSRLAWCPCQPS